MKKRKTKNIYILKLIYSLASEKVRYLLYSRRFKKNRDRMELDNILALGKVKIELKIK